AEACGAACCLPHSGHRRRRYAYACLTAWLVTLLAIVTAPPALIAATPQPLAALNAPGHAPWAAPALPTAHQPRLPLPLAPSQPTQLRPQQRPLAPEPGWLRLTTIDVAQGDATLIRMPDHSALMVDAGGSVTGAYDIGAPIVAPALWALGLRRLQVLALTHG